MTTTQQITRPIAAKVLKLIDAGLTNGLGEPKPGMMCVEAAVCYALGQPHGDKPRCVAPAVRAAKIALNDCAWSSNTARAQGLRRVGIAQLGSAGVIDERKFAKIVAEQTIRQIVPIALRSAAKLAVDEYGKLLIEHADKCAKAGTGAAARAAYAAGAAARAAGAADAAYAAYAAADAAARAAADAADAAYAADAAADAAARAAGAAGAAAYARDKILAAQAEIFVQALIECGSPGCKYLSLAPPPKKKKGKVAA